MDNSALVNEMKKVVNDLDESQLKVEKHAFDVINSWTAIRRWNAIFR